MKLLISSLPIPYPHWYTGNKHLIQFYACPQTQGIHINFLLRLFHGITCWYSCWINIQTQRYHCLLDHCFRWPHLAVGKHTLLSFISKTPAAVPTSMSPFWSSSKEAKGGDSHWQGWYDRSYHLVSLWWVCLALLHRTWGY